MRRTLLGIGAGGSVCALLSFATYTVLATPYGYVGEAVLWGVLVGMVAGVIGIGVGLIVVLGRLSLAESAVIGLLVAVIVWVLIAFVSGEPGRYGEALRFSLVYLEVFAVPASVGAVASALAARRGCRSVQLARRQRPQPDVAQADTREAG
jgi:hypothetical protein